ncbi:MAG TPA: hypothetical protein VJO14_01710, partial [Bacteroidota bacterium]|nr:hypothetical protein [Bacteroidota bacterium]
MKHEEYKELIHRELDGANSPSESRILHEFLSTDAGANQFFEEQRRLHSLLSSVPRMDPPENLMKIIMNTISTPEHHRRHSLIQFHTLQFTFSHLQEVFMKNKLIIGGVVAAFAVVYFAVWYPWPSDSEMFGTIGGAKKYRSEQISDKDVVVGNQQNSTDGTTDAGGINPATLNRSAEIFRTADVQRLADLFRSAD